MSSYNTNNNSLDDYFDEEAERARNGYRRLLENKVADEVRRERNSWDLGGSVVEDIRQDWEVDDDDHRVVKQAPGLPTAAAERKTYPIASGVLDYFPLAIAEVAHVSYVGNEQHNPGEPLHWDRSKSQDEADALVRHLLERGGIDSDGCRHSAKMAWRALALLQKELEDAQKHETPGD